MIQSLIMLLIYAIVIGLLAWLIFYVVDALGVPDPFGRIIKVVAVVIGVIAIILLLLKIPPAAAQDGHPCDAYAPYYHKVTTSGGSAMGDLFFFVFSAPMAVAIIGGPTRTLVNARTGQRVRVSTAACMPVSLVRHFGQSRPVHAEHWQIE